MQFALDNQFVDQLGVVNDLVIPAESRVLVLKSVQAVGTGCNDALGFYFVKQFHISCCKGEENVFATGAPGRIAGALLVLSKHGEIDSGSVQDICKGPGGLLGACIGCRGAAHPPKHIRFRVLVDGGNTQSFGPFHSFSWRNTPGVGSPLHAAESGLQLLGE